MPQTTTKPWQQQRDNVNKNDKHEPHWPIATPSYHLGGIPSNSPLILQESESRSAIYA